MCWCARTTYRIPWHASGGEEVPEPVEETFEDPYAQSVNPAESAEYAVEESDEGSEDAWQLTGR